jgi:hypothetical protein
MASGMILLALLAAAQPAAQSSGPHTERARATMSASVTIIAAEEVRFFPDKPSKAEARQTKSIRRIENGRVLIEFY